MVEVENNVFNFQNVVSEGKIFFNEPLKFHISIKVGGIADYYIEPNSESELINILNLLNENHIPLIIIGNGTNIIVSDRGIIGAVLNLESLRNIEIDEENIITIETGVLMNRFVDFCIKNNFQGVEMLSGIPGTIGGAIVMNAGAYGNDISNYLIDVKVFENGTIKIVTKDEANFSYRFSNFQSNKSIILSARFKFPKGKFEELRSVRAMLLKKRNSSQPLNFPNCGSIFKNPYPNYAAKIIEEIGFKGFRIGDAQVSEKHSNFIVNLGNATANDILSIVKEIIKTVKDKKQIQLEMEVKLLGFEEDELKGIVYAKK